MSPALEHAPAGVNGWPINSKKSLEPMRLQKPVEQSAGSSHSEQRSLGVLDIPAVAPLPPVPSLPPEAPAPWSSSSAARFSFPHASGIASKQATKQEARRRCHFMVRYP